MERFVGPHRYSASQSELLMEELCESFGAELLPAEPDVYFPDLFTRIAKPGIVENRSKGIKHLLAFQYTRFSPLKSDPDRLVEAWNVGQKKRNRIEYVEQIGRKVAIDGKYPPELITDRFFLSELSLQRFRKGIYVAAFDITGKDVEEEDLYPMEVLGGATFEDIRADLVMKYERRELFHRLPKPEDTDEINFYAPKLEVHHSFGVQRMREAASSNPGIKTKQLRDGYYSFPWDTLQVAVDTPALDVLTVIQAYLRGRFTGKSLS